MQRTDTSSTMDSETFRVREAVFDRQSESSTPYNSLAIKHKVSVSKIRTVFRHWCANASNSHPQSPADIRILRVFPGRPHERLERHESLLAEAASHYSENNTPLTRNGVMDLILQYREKLAPAEQSEFKVKHDRPSQTFINNFVQRNGLRYHHVKQVESLRLDALSPLNVTAHISRVRAAMIQFNISSPAQVFNVDQFGMSWAKIVERFLRKGVGRQNDVLLQKTFRKEGAIDRVTIMPISSAEGKPHKLVIIFQGRDHTTERLQEKRKPCTSY